jgi:copper(I)-binding protein
MCIVPVISPLQWYSVLPLHYRITPLRIPISLLLLSLATLSYGADSLSVTSAWLRGVPPGQSNSAAYMTLTNNSTESRRLVAVSSSQARAVEIHESIQVDGMWRMRQLAAVDLPAGEAFSLQPGGTHLMVFGLAPAPGRGDTVSFRLLLDNAEEILVTADVRVPGQSTDHQH